METDMDKQLHESVGHLVALELVDGAQVSGILVDGSEAPGKKHPYAIKTRAPVADERFEYIRIPGAQAVRSVKRLEPKV